MAWPPSGTRTGSGSACWSGSAWPSGPRHCTPGCGSSWAAELAEILADRLGERPDNLEVRIIAAAVAAAVWVAAEEWQAQDDGEGELGALIDQALGTVLGAGAPLRATPPPQEAMSEDLDHA
jgi:MftR C-terminal domain